MPGTLSIAIKTDLIAEFILRSRRSVDVAEWINRIVSDFLDRTRDDPKIWVPTADAATEIDESQKVFRGKHGDPQRGYQWFPLFLPNGTSIRMQYKRKYYYADVRHEQIVYEGVSLTPSELARQIAGHTNRNAWRDLWLKIPNSGVSWMLADSLRSTKLTDLSTVTTEDLGI